MVENKNNLIIEFMGLIFTPESKHKYRPDLDWSLLMLVVEKIESLGYYCMINKWTSIYSLYGLNRVEISIIQGKSKIENTYKACLIFIKWFNKNK